MKRPLTLYMDESGNRHPDKDSDQSRTGRDWFGFGGVLVRGEDNDAARQLVLEFSERWRLPSPVHLTDMLAERKRFSWLGRLDQRTREEFWSDWRGTICNAPLIGMACVIDRPGYVRRGYLEKHGANKWLLCRSAFDICVERAAKIARLESRKLHVVFEQDPSFNKVVVGYFDNLKANGLEFDASNSGKYSPLTKTQFNETLGRIEYKPKSHPLLQYADSYVYAMCRYGYDRKFWMYRSLRDSKRIADYAIEPIHMPHLGVKYYCFD
jgi:hypothetical protein